MKISLIFFYATTYTLSVPKQSRKIPGGARVGGLTIPLTGIPEEEPFPVVYNFKVMRRFAHPFSLSFSLSSLSSDTLSFPLTSSNIHGVLMPPAAACKLSCRLQQSQVSLVAGLSNSWFSLPLCHLC